MYTYFLPFFTAVHISEQLVLQTIYVLNKKIWAKNPRFVIESGFKSKAGYNGARTVCKTCRNNIIHSALFYAIGQTPLHLQLHVWCIFFLYFWQCQNQIGGLFSLFWIVKPPTFYIYHENFICSISFRKFNSRVQSFCHIFLKPSHTAWMSICITKRQAISTDAFQAC